MSNEDHRFIDARQRTSEPRRRGAAAANLGPAAERIRGGAGPRRRTNLGPGDRATDGFVRGSEAEGARLRVDATFLAFGSGFGAWAIPNAFVQQKVAEREADGEKVIDELFRSLAGNTDTVE